MGLRTLLTGFWSYLESIGATKLIRDSPPRGVLVGSMDDL